MGSDSSSSGGGVGMPGTSSFGRASTQDRKSATASRNSGSNNAQGTSMFQPRAAEPLPQGNKIGGGFGSGDMSEGGVKEQMGMSGLQSPLSGGNDGSGSNAGVVINVNNSDGFGSTQGGGAEEQPQQGAASGPQQPERGQPEEPGGGARGRGPVNRIRPSRRATLLTDVLAETTRKTLLGL